VIDPEGTGGTGCATCHGTPPPPPHPPAADLAACHFCHAQTVDAGGALAPGGPHMNGQVDIALGSGGGSTGCQTCHGYPPPPPHPSSTDCAPCHGDNFGAGQHMNGAVDLVPASCSVCHTMPPTTARHPLHLGAGIFCTTCHAGFSETTIVPAQHLNGTVDVAIPGGTWTASSRTCSLSCHSPLTGLPWQP
jgi:hypothetical protein